MKFKAIKKLIPFCVGLAIVASLSSCNRGVGCPTNFSVTDNVVEEAIKILPKLVVNKE